MGQRLGKLGLLTALALISFLVENLFPPLFIPGARLGLGNLFITLTIIYFSLGEGLLAVFVKAVLSSLFIGNFSALLYSLSAGIFSAIVTYFLIKIAKGKFSITFIASASALCHNLVQLAVFSLITKTAKVLLYAPYLAFLGIFSGLLTGFLTYYILKIIPPKFFIGRENGNMTSTKKEGN